MNYPRADQSLRYLHGLRSQKLLPFGWNVLSETARGHSEVLVPLQTPLTYQQALASSCGQQLPRSAAGNTDHTGTRPSMPPFLNGSVLSLGVLSLTVCKAQVPSALHQAEESTLQLDSSWHGPRVPQTPPVQAQAVLHAQCNATCSL